MADISIDEAKARIWLDDVKSELNAVSDLLTKVYKVTSDPAGSDDTIMQNIGQLATSLDNKWKDMSKSFEIAQEKMLDALKKLFSTTGDVIDHINDLKSKV